MHVWQVGGSGDSRNLDKLFMNYDVMLIGPGDHGDFRTQKYTKTNVGSTDYSFVRGFACDVAEGDIVILRMGTREVVAVGRVVMDPRNEIPTEAKYQCSPTYFYVPGFGDIDGWDLQHAHRVIWRSSPKTFNTAVFGAQPSRFSGVNNPEVVKWAEENCPTEIKNTFAELPLPLESLDDEKAADELFKTGLSLQSVESTISSIQRIRRLSKWYHKEGWPFEHEIVGFMTLPLLLSLGWSEQQLAIEWKRIDIAGFRKIPDDNNKLRRPENCQMVIEVKQFYQGLNAGLNQAREYESRIESRRPRICVATDGVRFRLIQISGVANDENGSEDSSAYMNLEKLTSVNVLQRLMPGYMNLHFHQL